MPTAHVSIVTSFVLIVALLSSFVFGVRRYLVSRSYKQVEHLLVDFHGNAVLDKVARFNFYARHRWRCMLGDYPIRFWLFVIQQFDWLTPNIQRPQRSNNELFWVTLWNFTFEIEMLDLFIRP